MRPLVGHCHLGFGKLYRGTAKREQTLDHIATVTATYREMGMCFWLEQAAAEISALARGDGQPPHWSAAPLSSHASCPLPTRRLLSRHIRSTP